MPLRQQAVERDKVNIILIRKMSLQSVECVENGKKHLLTLFPNVKFSAERRTKNWGMIKEPRYCIGRYARIATISSLKGGMTSDLR